MDIIHNVIESSNLDYQVRRYSSTTMHVYSFKDHFLFIEHSKGMIDMSMRRKKDKLYCFSKIHLDHERENIFCSISEAVEIAKEIKTPKCVIL
jgi:hypothetical protein